jgi:hypothetical protein
MLNSFLLKKGRNLCNYINILCVWLICFPLFYPLIIQAQTDRAGMFTNLTFTGSGGQGIGGYDQIGAVELISFFPTTSSNLYPFIEANIHSLKKRREWATNVGAGIRYIPNGDRIWGANVYYDTRSFHYFQQLGVGLEMLSPAFDIRLNGYFPVVNKKYRGHAYIYRYPGGFVGICHEKREALAGGDFEIGKKFLTSPVRCDVAAGLYYYHQKCGGHSITGGKARILFNYLNYMSVEVQGAYDSVFRSTCQALFMFTVPFGQPSLVYQPIKRQGIIMKGKKYCSWKVNW